jgi:hypothetical protein
MYQLFNATDGILASERLFETPEAAAKAATEWRARYEGRYYRTGTGIRIDPDQVWLQVLPIEGDWRIFRFHKEEKTMNFQDAKKALGPRLELHFVSGSPKAGTTVIPKKAFYFCIAPGCHRFQMAVTKCPADKKAARVGFKVFHPDEGWVSAPSLTRQEAARYLRGVRKIARSGGASEITRGEAEAWGLVFAPLAWHGWVLNT